MEETSTMLLPGVCALPFLSAPPGPIPLLPSIQPIPLLPSPPAYLPTALYSSLLWLSAPAYLPMALYSSLSRYGPLLQPIRLLYCTAAYSPKSTPLTAICPRLTLPLSP
eukprot:729319-Rhodomonas_salina.1